MLEDGEAAPGLVITPRHALHSVMTSVSFLQAEMPSTFFIVRANLRTTSRADTGAPARRDVALSPGPPGVTVFGNTACWRDQVEVRSQVSRVAPGRFGRRPYEKRKRRKTTERRPRGDGGRDWRCSYRPRGAGATAATGAGGGGKGAPAGWGGGAQPCPHPERSWESCRLKPLSLQYFVMAAGGPNSINYKRTWEPMTK